MRHSTWPVLFLLSLLLMACGGSSSDGNGNGGDDETSGTFSFEPGAWYRLTNLFLGAGESLAVDGNSNCVMSASAPLSAQYWQFEEVGLGNGATTTTIINLATGARSGLNGSTLNAECEVPGYPLNGIFPGQAWTLVPESGGQFKLRSEPLGSGVSLDVTLMRTDGNFSGQFWTAQLLDDPVATGVVGISGNGNPFELECPAGNNATSLLVNAGDDIDRIELGCAPDTGGIATPVGAVGGSGGSPTELQCPSGTVLAGFAGAWRGDGVIPAPGADLFGVVDRFGLRCRWPFQGIADEGRFLGVLQTAGAFTRVDCPVNMRMTGITGIAGDLFAQLGGLCRPVTTQVFTSATGGDGGTRYSLQCLAGTAAIGFRGRAGDDIDQLELVCADGNGTQSSAGSVGAATGGGDMGNQLVCDSGVLVGINVSTRNLATAVVDQLGARCSTSPDPVRDHGLAGTSQSGSAVAAVDCPDGMFVSGIIGSAGDLLDSITLRCSSN